MKSVSVSRPSGFTIVELLIVIVVIALLAAISVVAFTGVQQRARNSARLSAAHNIHKQLELYTYQTGRHFGSNVFCIPTEANYDAGNGGLPDCYLSTGPRSENATANNNFAAENIKFSYPNSPITASSGTVYYGIHVAYLSNLSQGMNGTLRPHILVFYLEGSNQDCGPNSVRSASSAQVTNDPLNSIVSVRNASSLTEMTTCYLSLTHDTTI